MLSTVLQTGEEVDEKEMLEFRKVAFTETAGSSLSPRNPALSLSHHSKMSRNKSSDTCNLVIYIVFFPAREPT